MAVRSACRVFIFVVWIGALFLAIPIVSTRISDFLEPGIPHIHSFEALWSADICNSLNSLPFPYVTVASRLDWISGRFAVHILAAITNFGSIGALQNLRLRPPRHARPMPGVRNGAAKKGNNFKLHHL